MAATKKSAKRSTGKKRPTPKSSSKRGTKKAAASKRRVPKGSKGLPALGAVRKAGKKTWKRLKSTTAQVVEGVKETFGG